MTAPSSAAGVAHLLIVAGQSNAVGYGANATELPANLYTPQRDIPYQYNISGIAPSTTFTALRWLNGGGSASVYPKFNGPEISLARDIADAAPGTKYVVVKVAYNGTSLARDWDPKTSGSLFTTLTQTVGAVRSQLTARGMTSQIDGMFWMQGETDATISGWANSYQSNLTAFIASCRTAFGAPQMPFVLGRINNVAGWTYGTTVRAAQVAVADADPLVEWVDTDALPLYSDNVHYTCAGEVTLGDEMAAAFFALTAPRGLQGSPVAIAAPSSATAPALTARMTGAGEMAVSFDLPRAARVGLAVVDASGRLLASVPATELAAGRHTQSVGGVQGRGLAFVVLRAGGETHTVRVVHTAR